MKRNKDFHPKSKSSDLIKTF